ncbi:P-loop containing nucleoside triphosphate hydrolase protein [Coprinopsis sp. MPI-PUGE-AT-0042]|nr:P-loop containing nucleoside triphosphate hydrolase protein [Coprinopsis sp. MPI-PUGE-AT-0042]
MSSAVFGQVSFWLPIATAIEEGHTEKISIVIAPLNLLGKQNENELRSVGISAIAVNKESASKKVFDDIEKGKYNVVIINPEILTDSGGRMDALLRKPSFASRLLNIIFDEAHCVSTWSRFRGAYLDLGILCYLLPGIPFYIASATLPSGILSSVMDILDMKRNETKFIIHSNDRADIHLMVKEMEHAVNSYKDLSFLIPDSWTETKPPPPKFLVFFDSIPETEHAVAFLRSRLPKKYAEKVRYFHAPMMNEFREEHLELFRSSETWGLCVTDTFGMGMDLPDVKVVVQYRATCDLNTLWRRFGRAARGEGTDGVTILLVEAKELAEERQNKAQWALKRLESKQKNKQSKSKRPRTGHKGAETERAGSGACSRSCCRVLC